MRTRRLAPLTATLALAAALAHADTVAPRTTEFGHGPTIVFVHGLGGGRNDWLPTARRLMGAYHVVLVDLAGHGDTPLPDPFSLAASAAALDQVIAQQPPDSTIVVAHQLAGMVALEALAAHPAHARGLLLIDSPLKSPLPVSDQQRKQVLDFMDQNYDQFARGVLANMGRDSVQSAEIFAVVSRTPAATVKAYFGAALSADENKDARALRGQLALAITDRLWTSGGWPAAARRLGWEDTTLVTPRHIANAGYWVMKDQPDTLAAMVATFAAERLGLRK